MVLISNSFYFYKVEMNDIIIEIYNYYIPKKKKKKKKKKKEKKSSVYIFYQTIKNVFILYYNHYNQFTFNVFLLI